ncbi:hypothetical protein H4R34_002424 [Dimargaris verticillata]|uniref:peptide-methionine (S)-S-oxide reductase n=1 Tax=Dimargaris verticillata TaxID=2761393 RepID=A0A9W8B813_9FUNG|nr:hypothetical protein H4R34_002424 [Dimargaris verticillata]
MPVALARALAFTVTKSPTQPSSSTLIPLTLRYSAGPYYVTPRPSAAARLIATKFCLSTTTTNTMASPSPATEKATFAAGCFWSVELAFRRLFGVNQVRVGYAGGTNDSPTYEEVCSGSTGHAEAVELNYDPNTVSYNDLLEVFWRKHDPTTMNRQGNDVGSQYRSAIFYHTQQQKQLAEHSKQQVEQKLGKPVVTQIIEATKFYPAEDYHQAYLEKRGQSAAKGCTDNIRCYG